MLRLLAIIMLTTIVVFADLYCVFAQGLPETPAELPQVSISIEGGGTQRPRYEYSDKKDQLTDQITRQLTIVFSVTVEDRGFLDAAVYIESLWVNRSTSKGGTSALLIAVARSSDRTLGSLFLPSYKIIYRPKGQEAVSVEVIDHKIDMTSWGGYEEQAIALMSPKQLVELLTSPLVRLTGNEGSKDYQLTETDKKAVLWFVENNIPRGKEVVSAVRERLATLEKSDKN